MTFSDQLRNLIESHEGRVASMYCDSAGIPTVGVGHAVFSVDEARGLRFHYRDSNSPAPPAAIEAEYIRVKRIPLTARNIALAVLFMPEDSITVLFYEDLQRFARRLVEELPEFSALPDNARLACFDISFNVGSLRGWPKLRAAVGERNWAVAAAECFRPQLEPHGNPGTAEHPHGIRNIDTRNLFLACQNF